MWPAILAVILCLAVLVTGGMATTATSLGVPEGVLYYAMLHRQAGEVLGAALIAVLAWIVFAKPKARMLAALLCLAAVLQGVLGALPLGTTAAVVHACLAQMLLAGTVALAASLSPAWDEPPQTIRDYGWPSLRSMALFLPVLVTMQVGLGAAFRHRILGLMPHVIGAMLVSMIILIAGSFVLQQCKDHKTLAGLGRATMVFTFVQVFLGLAVFTVRSMPPDATVILVVATGHVATGAALLACCVVLGMFVRKNVIPKT
ncbi:MAG: COX15/CtaA family protein [Bryobacteraceae bacterium]